MYIQVTLDDFEKQFGVKSKKDPNKRAFELFRPEGAEAYYLCKLFELETGTLFVKILTSIRSDRRKARGVGEDAIRIMLAWEDNEDENGNKWFKCLDKGKRVFRSGGTHSTANDVIKRTINRAREMATGAQRIKKCPNCYRPMVPRQGPTGWFYGCIGYANNKICTQTLDMSIEEEHKHEELSNGH